jgi:thiol-disulfide isomerase/thioredoxin
MLNFFIIIALLFPDCKVTAMIREYKNAKTIKYSEQKQRYFPDSIELFDEKNEKFFLDKIEDRPILLVFWATWCAHCAKEISSLDVLKKDFRKLPIEILAVSEDYQGIDTVKKFYQMQEIRHLNILHDYRLKLFSALNLTSLPYAYIIDENKKIVLSFDGSTSWHDPKVRQIILDHIPGNPVMPQNTYKAESLTINNKKIIN